MKTKSYIFSMLFLFISFGAVAQEYEHHEYSEKSAFKFRTWEGFRSDFGLSYNFFVGNDAEDFRTSIKGFGSGFLLDLYSARISWDVFSIGTPGVNVSVGAGFGFANYRFAENLIIQNEGGVVSWDIDDDPTHDYGERYFEFGKSKLVSTTFAVPVNFNAHMGDFFLSMGGTYDLFLTGKLKRYFRENGEKQKLTVGHEKFNDFPLNRHKLGLSGSIMHKPSGLNIGMTYMVTPFFEENLGPDLNEVRISVSYCFSNHLRYGNDGHRNRRHHWWD